MYPNGLGYAGSTVFPKYQAFKCEQVIHYTI